MKSETKSNNRQRCTLFVIRETLDLRKTMLYLVILLLASGYVTLCSHIHREYYLINEAKKWDEAQSYCRQHYFDFATVGSPDEVKMLGKMATASGVTKDIWIGLKKTETVSSWMWSVGETQSSHGLAEYTNWASLPESSHNCGGVGGDGKWLGATCSTKLPFVCQEYKGSNGLYVVLEEKSWRQAQKHCRQNNSDLASVRSHTENQALQKTAGPSLTFFWVGLFRDQWKWSDQKNSSFRYWYYTQPNHDGRCGLYSPRYKTWFDRGCAYSRPFFCYDVERIRLQLVRMEIKSNLFFNISDPAMSKGILNQLQKKYEGFKLQWRVQPDGKIFRKKGKKKV